MKLINGDCLEVMQGIESQSIDMILCDLPYGTTNCKWDTIIPFDKLWEQYNRIIKPNGAIVLFGNEPFSSYLRLSNIKNYRYDWKWDKVTGGNPLNAKRIPFQVVEDIMIFYKKSGAYTPIMEEAKKENIRPVLNGPENKTNLTNIECFKPCKDYDKNKRYPKNLLSYHNRNKELNPLNRLHPTQKPVELLEYLIKTYTNEGETILDNTMGVGSCGVAAVNTNRHFIGIELDKNYYEIAKKRIEEVKNEVNQWRLLRGIKKY